MKSEIGLVTGICGLSNEEAAEFLDVRIDTLKSWSSGRRRYPPEPLARLRTLWGRIEDIAEEKLKDYQLHVFPGEVLKLSVAVDDQEARSMGLPCVGAHQAVLGLIIARLPSRASVVLVPQGETRSYFL